MEYFTYGPLKVFFFLLLKQLVIHAQWFVLSFPRQRIRLLESVGQVGYKYIKSRLMVNIISRLV